MRTNYFDLLNTPAHSHPTAEKAQSLIRALANYPVLEFPPTTITPYTFDYWIQSSSIAERIDPGFTQSLTNSISNLAGRPVQVTESYLKIHETTFRTPVELGVKPNSITIEEYQTGLNQQAVATIQDLQDGDKGDKVEKLQANIQYLLEQKINTDFIARNELNAGQRPKTIALVNGHITIGYGFDCFTHNASDLEALNLPFSTKQKVTPALQISTSTPDFWTIYASLGQHLTDDDALLLFSAKLIKTVQRLASNQFSASWPNLPQAARTVAVDLYYNFGENQNFQNFQQAINSQDWPTAIHELRNWNGVPNDPSLEISKRLEARARYLAVSFGYEQ
ncbi:hypothetical protein [Pseudomonas citronellolis]|uniref:hypothetical protein n=1 Tax=Pseudomonas citronellolis TaxID=53408 RepID=UPI003C2B2091